MTLTPWPPLPHALTPTRERGNLMKPSDRYLKWIEWSEEDATYLGKCPDLITGIHGDDPVKLYVELHDVVEDVIRHFEVKGRVLPLPISPSPGRV